MAKRRGAAEDRRERLAALVEKVGETYRGLSKTIGKNDAYLWQYIEQGRPKELAPETIDRLADTIGLTRSWVHEYLDGGNELPIPQSARKAVQPVVLGPPRSTKGERALPIYGRPTPDGGGLLMTSEAVEYTARPPILADAEEGFGVTAPNDDMSPRYKAGDVLYVNPLKPPRSGSDLLVVLKDGRALVGILISRDGHYVQIQGRLGAAPTKVPVREIERMAAIVGVEWR